MPRENLAEVNLDVGLDPKERPVAHADGDPFRIAIVGDFSGRANRRARQLECAAPKPVLIEPDNFEAVMRSMGVSLELPDELEIRFNDLDDFHPDQLYERLPLFRSLRDVKKDLANPQTFRATSERLRPREPLAAPPSQPASSGSLLDQIAEGSPGPAHVPARAPRGHGDDKLDDAIRQIVARHAVPGIDPRQEEMLATVDKATSGLMRAILHRADFQGIEAAWRSIFFLLHHLESGVELKIYLIDLSFEEFLNGDASLRRIFAERAVGEDPWSVIAGLYTFSPTERDCAALARMGALARQAGAPFIAGMSPRLFGCEAIGSAPDPEDWKKPLSPEDAAAWKQLRNSAHAGWIGLAMPRFVLRLPYGKKTDAIDAFHFEEIGEKPEHEAYLWANPSIACVCLLGEAFDRMGWEMQPDAVKRIDGLPLHVGEFGDATPPAEIWMTERFAARVLDEGIMPLASVKNSDSVLLVRFQSIAEPKQKLAGPW